MNDRNDNEADSLDEGVETPIDVETESSDSQTGKESEPEQTSEIGDEEPEQASEIGNEEPEQASEIVDEEPEQASEIGNEEPEQASEIVDEEPHESIEVAGSEPGELTTASEDGAPASAADTSGPLDEFPRVAEGPPSPLVDVSVREDSVEGRWWLIPPEPEPEPGLDIAQSSGSLEVSEVDVERGSAQHSSVPPQPIIEVPSTLEVDEPSPNSKVVIVVAVVIAIALGIITQL